jgi:pimeloyl-ACP methyl ester carboxylesterase
MRSLVASSDAHPGGVSISRYSPDWTDKPPASMAEMLDRVADLENFDGALIAVQRIVGSDGVARILVVLPGLRHFAPSRDPQDLLGAAAAEAGTATGYTRCVRLALDAARVPSGAEVVLTGHSQGGIVAMDLAGDPSFNGGRVRVAQVIAAGSPISSKAVAPGTPTRVFNVESVNDIVTHLDVVESPTAHQSVEKLTYRFAIDEHDPGRTHDVSLYSRQLRRLADSPNPLLSRVNAVL